jgi:predicted dehydrogenase
MTISMLICGSGDAGLAVARAATTDGRGSIVGLFDPRAEQLDRALERYPDARAGGNYVRLLDETCPDAVCVAGPDHLHAEQAITALQHDCHVLIEKPLATTVEDAQRIVDAASATGLHVMTDHTMRYLYPWRETALAAKAGEVGDIFFVEGDYVHDMWAWYSPEGPHYTPWRVDARNPQNILLGGGCHPIDLMLWTVDAPVAEVFAYSNKLSMPEFPSDDCYIVVLRFQNEVLGKVHVTSGCAGNDMGSGFLTVYGTEGTLWQGVAHRRGGEAVPLEDTSSANTLASHGWGGSVAAFFDTVAGEVENPIPARVGARTVAVCDAALRAIETGRPQQPVPF